MRMPASSSAASASSGSSKATAEWQASKQIVTFSSPSGHHSISSSTVASVPSASGSMASAIRVPRSPSSTRRTFAVHVSRSESQAL